MSTLVQFQKIVLLALCCLQVAQSMPALDGIPTKGQVKGVLSTIDSSDELVVENSMTARLSTERHYDTAQKFQEKAEPHVSKETKGLEEIEGLNTEETDEAMKAWNSAELTFNRYMEDPYSKTLKTSQELAVIEDLKGLRLFLAYYGGMFLNREIERNPSEAENFEKDLWELMNIHHLLLPHVEKKFSELGGDKSIINYLFQESDITELIYYWYGSSSNQQSKTPVEIYHPHVDVSSLQGLPYKDEINQTGAALHTSINEFLVIDLLDISKEEKEELHKLSSLGYISLDYEGKPNMIWKAASPPLQNLGEKITHSYLLKSALDVPSSETVVPNTCAQLARRLAYLRHKIHVLEANDVTLKHENPLSRSITQLIEFMNAIHLIGREDVENFYATKSDKQVEEMKKNQVK